MKKPCNNCENAYFYNGKYYTGYNKICYNCEKYKKYKEYLESKRKYIVGETIKNLDELLNQEFVFWRGINKPLHITVVRNWQFNIVYKGVKSGCFCKAVRKEK